MKIHTITVWALEETLKNEHGKQMEWMLSLPGDWHILFNYQKVLLKIYGDAGLLQIAKVGGHWAETLASYYDILTPG